MVEYKKLSELCEILDSKRKPISKKDRISGPYPYYGATGVLDYVDNYIFDEPLILVGEDGAKWGSGEQTAYKIEGKSWVNNHAHVIRPDRAKVVDNYLLYFFNQLDLTPYITGAIIEKLNQEKLRNIIVPLPCIKEQQRIVKILDKAEEIRTKKKLANEKLDEFLKSTFIDMFGDPVTNPNNYPIQALEDVTKFITDGKHGDCEDEIGSGYYFVSAKCINNGRIDLTQARQIKYSDYQDVNKRVKINLNDLLMVNTGATIGKMAIVRNPNIANCITLQKSVAVINIDNTKLLTEYLCYCLKCKSIANVSAGSAIRNLLLSTMRSYKLPIPPIAMQDKFSKIVQKVEAQKEKNQKVIEQMDNLFNSLMQQAFNGEL